MLRNSSSRYKSAVLATDNGCGGGSGTLWRMPSAEDISRIRAKLDLSQQEFADRFGFEIESVRNWEQDKRKPSKSAVVLLRMVGEFPEETGNIISKLSSESRERK